MTTSAITQRPATFTAAAAVVAAVAFSSVTVWVSQHSNADQSSRNVTPVVTFSRASHFGIPTTGGHVVTGQ